MTSKWDITILNVKENRQREFIVGEQTRNHVIQTLEEGVLIGDWDITVVDVEGNRQREFSVGEQTRDHVIQTLQEGVDQGDGKEVLL
jgi:hypothetical protein